MFNSTLFKSDSEATGACHHEALVPDVLDPESTSRPASIWKARYETQSL